MWLINQFRPLGINCSFKDPPHIIIVHKLWTNWGKTIMEKPWEDIRHISAYTPISDKSRWIYIHIYMDKQPWHSTNREQLSNKRFRMRKTNCSNCFTRKYVWYHQTKSGSPTNSASSKWLGTKRETPRRTVPTLNLTWSCVQTNRTFGTADLKNP